jgi:hypothetical protein
MVCRLANPKIVKPLVIQLYSSGWLPLLDARPGSPNLGEPEVSLPTVRCSGRAYQASRNRTRLANSFGPPSVREMPHESTQAAAIVSHRASAHRVTCSS